MASAFKAVGVLGIFPCSRTSPRKPASANATAIVSLCTSRPTYVIGFDMALYPPMAPG